MVSVQNLKGEIIQLILSRKRGGHVPCKRRLGGVALTRYMDGRTDGRGDSYIPPPPKQSLGGYNNVHYHIERT
jgi:hypothetical protein